jgi:transketolase
MAHGPEQHIEHAEHAQHAAHDPFDKRVTVSIAVLAAVLAAVTMAGHKAHNATLRLQGEALKEQSEVGIYRTETANQYAYYQAKKNLSVLYEALLDLVGMLPIKDGAEKIQDKAREKWKSKFDKYQQEMPEMVAQAEKLKADAKDHKEKADKLLKESHAVHAQADRFDIGELGLQLGVVLCSMAILTRSRSFWYSGLFCGFIGLLVAVSGALNLFMGEGGHH